MNALAGIAEDILQNSGIDFSTLLPLMKQTVNKLNNLKPALAQTGPAVRGDQKVMKSHMDMLEYSPEYKQVYALLSSIITSHQNAKNEI